MFHNDRLKILIIISYLQGMVNVTFEQQHDKTNNMACVPREDSD